MADTSGRAPGAAAAPRGFTSADAAAAAVDLGAFLTGAGAAAAAVGDGTAHISLCCLT